MRKGGGNIQVLVPFTAIAVYRLAIVGNGQFVLMYSWLYLAERLQLVLADGEG